MDPKIRQSLVAHINQARQANENTVSPKDKAYYRGYVAGMKLVINIVFGNEIARQISVESWEGVKNESYYNQDHSQNDG